MSSCKQWPPEWRARHRTIALRLLANAMLVGLTVTTPLEARELRLSVEACSSDTQGQAAVLRAMPSSASASEVRIPIELPWRGSLDLDDRSAWRVQVVSASAWFQPLELHDGWGLAAQVIPCWRAARILFDLDPREARRTAVVRAAVKSELKNRFILTPNTLDPRPSGELVPLGFVVPEAPIRLWIEARGFLPFEFDAVPTAERSLDLGRLRLVQASSISGQVAIISGAALADLNATLYGLTNQISPRAGHSPISRQSLDRSGRFSFEDLPAGTYFVRVESGPRVLAVSSHVPVAAGEKVQLAETLEIRALPTLEIIVSPSGTPVGLPWQYSLLRDDDSNSQARSDARHGDIPDDGVLTLPEVEPGTYSFRVVRDENIWATAEFIAAPEDGNRVISIAVDWLEIRGEIFRGEMPLRTGLQFKSEAGEILHFKSDKEGEFNGILPKPGVWEVEIRQGVSGSTRVKLHPVELNRRKDGKPTLVRLEVPDTVIHGRVLKEEDLPVSSARVTAWSESPASRGAVAFDFSSIDGKYELEGLPAGILKLQAEAPDGQVTSTESIQLREKDDQVVDLRITKNVSISGLLRRTGLAVAGARVSLWNSSTEGAALPVFFTDVNGGFKGKVRPGNYDVLATIPGLGYRMISSDLEEGSRIEIDFSEPASRWTLYPPTVSPATNPLDLHLISAAGRAIPMHAILESGVVDEARGALVIPNVQAGRSVLCGMQTGCVEVYFQPGKETVTFLEAAAGTEERESH